MVCAHALTSDTLRCGSLAPTPSKPVSQAKAELSISLALANPNRATVWLLANSLKAKSTWASTVSAVF